MSNETPLTETIIENAKSAKRAKGDNGELEQHNLKDLIEVDRHIANQQAANKGAKSLKFSKIVPPGSV